MDNKLIEEKLKNLGFKIIDVKEQFEYHSYHIYAIYRNGYALSICQGISCYNGDYTYEVALGWYDNEFHLVYKRKFNNDVLGWQTIDDIIKLAKSIKRYKNIKERDKK